MIRFTCHRCHSGLRAPDRTAGFKVNCPKCRSRLCVPLAEIVLAAKKPSPGNAYLIPGVIGVGVLAVLTLVLVWAFTGEKAGETVIAKGQSPPRALQEKQPKKVAPQKQQPPQELSPKEQALQKQAPQELEPVLTPALASVKPSTQSPTGRRLLKPGDLVYKGSFAPPRVVNNISTSYTNIGLAMRIVDGKHRFFAGAGPNDTGVYEMDFPGLSAITADKKTCPSAKVVKWWGDIWQGKCVLTDQIQLKKHGLYWNETSQRLYWTYGSGYPASGANDSCFGWTDLSGLTPKAHGPFRVMGGAVSPSDKSTRAVSSSCHGGITRIPGWFAEKYTQGKAFGVGFGGYYSIISSGVSMGPALFAINDPDDGKKDYSAIPCVAYTYTNGPPGTHYCKRSPDYLADNDWSAVSPVKGVGTWTGMDSIRSAGCWVDLPDVSGLVFMAKITKGKVNYQVMNGRAKGGGSDNWLYIYDPADLAAVATGKKNPWEIDPASMIMFPTPLGGLINGMVFEAGSRTLFVLATFAIRDTYESYPVIHAYQVK